MKSTIYCLFISLVVSTAVPAVAAITTTPQPWSAVISITTPSLTSSVLTLEHNLTSTGGEVTVRCSGGPPAGTTAASSLYSLKLSRLLSSSAAVALPVSLLTIFHHSQAPQILYPLEGATGYGSVTQNYLALRMSRAGCQDAGLYICEATYLTNNVFTFTANQSLVVKVKPGYLSMTTFPAYNTWAVNNTVTLTCSGPIGTADPGAQVIWHWEYWDNTNLNWQRYNPPPSDVITQGTSQQACYESGAVSLKRTLQLADSERTYRCYVERGGTTYEQYSGLLRLGRVLSADGVPSAAASREEDAYRQGLAVGGGIGAAAASGLSFLVLGLCCCLYGRGLRQGVDPEQPTGQAKTTRGSRLPVKVNKQSPVPPVAATTTTTVATTTIAKSSTASRSVASQTVSRERGLDVPDNADVIGGLETPGPDSEAMLHEEVVDLASAQQQQAAAEDVLRMLLSTRHVMSWKVTGGASYTSFVLHLTPSSDDVITFSGLQYGRWHRKRRGSADVATMTTQQRVVLLHGKRKAALRRKRLALPAAPSVSFNDGN